MSVSGLNNSNLYIQIIYFFNLYKPLVKIEDASEFQEYCEDINNSFYEGHKIDKKLYIEYCLNVQQMYEYLSSIKLEFL